MSKNALLSRSDVVADPCRDEVMLLRTATGALLSCYEKHQQ